jgi:hypothetical protein
MKQKGSVLTRTRHHGHICVSQVRCHKANACSEVFVLISGLEEDFMTRFEELGITVF